MRIIVIFCMVAILAFPLAIALAADLVDNGDGTVTDKATNLMWQQADNGIKKWQEAVSTCDELLLAGKDDWRLPKMDELKTLVHETLVQPAIDRKFFPDFPHTRLLFWTATEPDKYGKYKAYVVVFNEGTDAVMNKSGKQYFKCVRNIK